jgi:DnaJ-class molecular chaperone
LLVALGVRRDGQKVLLAIKNMGGESEAAWRALLDNLVTRGLAKPDLVIVDGGSGLDKALAALWPDAEVKPHRFFTREGDDIHLALPVSLTEAVLGAEVRVPTTTGAVSMKVPKGANTGRVLRLKGKGVVRPDGSRGDQYVNINVVLPDKIDPELEAFVTNWAAGKAEDPRAGMER